MPLNTCQTAQLRSPHRLYPLAGAAVLLAALVSNSVWAQNFPITAGQRATANQVAETGVPLSELAPNAPDSYTIVRGDTLWRISGIFLRSPWRWPELWGMNLDEIKNPHRIYPGQVLYLDKTGGRARLSTRRPGSGEPATVRVSPRIRSESLSDSAIPPISMQDIEAFLAEPLIVDEATFARAPRIVATPENRVLLSLGDRAYARGSYGSNTDDASLSLAAGKPRNFRVFRNAVPLKDPGTGEVLAYEAQYVGKAYLVREEGRVAFKPAPTANTSAAPAAELVPATIDIVQAKEEMRVGDRLLPEPPREFSNYVPRAPGSTQAGQIVSVYGNAVTFASQNQVVAINRGREHGMENGHVLALLRDTSQIVDKTDESRPTMRLPGERNGLMMVFRTFDKVSYALVLQINDGVKVGDRFVNP
ncbi:LysM peptidoglycan-binding domain-containing protein [Hydrogenophaga sp.]|jgi:hypothetical protein|uniref:LysM peptidoglycan-binding domain-containing protein n=1 Tax=Hydrogenophaga sp. TaxID=1904254 RepID=UPI002733ECB9|nr:LysM domain-containing protein [Hydrogenophaga sp.]MDP3884854.1 LysM domain-containing protein [Hydrogenophaga sp.]